MDYRPLPPIQQRLVIDLLQTYRGYREARQQAAQYAGGLSWKTLRGRQYLIKTLSRHGATKSHGPRSPATEALLDDFVTGRAQAREREAALLTTVRQLAAMAKGTEVARVPVTITAILRQVDRSFQPVSGQGFKVISNKGCCVELLKPTSSPAWQPDRAAPGRHFPSIVIGRDGFPAPMVAPDPRLFALYQHEMRQPMDRAAASAHLPLDASMERMSPNTTASSADAPSVA